MPTKGTLMPIAPARNSCQNCLSRKHCVVRDLEPQQLSAFDRNFRRRRVYHKGELLFRQGDSFCSLSVVQSGATKGYVIARSGEFQVTGFHFGGTLLGTGGIALGRHTESAAALGTADVCKLEFKALEALPLLRYRLMSMLSHELNQRNQQLLMVGKMSAPQRLALFILDTTERLGRHHPSNRETIFPMLRHDIASYLSLAMETVSRLLTQFSDAGLIDIKHRRVRVAAPNALRAIADGGPLNPAAIRRLA